MVAKRTGPSRSDNNSCASPSPWERNSYDYILIFDTPLHYINAYPITQNVLTYIPTITHI